MDTSNTQIPRSARRAARAEAAAWIVRLHGPHRSPELEAGLRAWLAADPENGRQFERVTEVWDAGSSVPIAGVPRMTRWKQSPSQRVWALAAMILLACGLGVWGAYQLWFNPSYSTGIGEQRLVRLEDGTRLSLNSNTRVQIAYRDTERRIRLERGEVYFEVGRNPARPFVVVVGDHQVTALGTAFVVRYESSRTAVTLVEGKVAVDEDLTREVQRARIGGAVANEAGAGAVVLAPGQRLTLTGRAAPKIDEPRMETVIAWRHGEVMLDKTALADAVAEMNRYDEVTLVIDDANIAGLRISGVYHTGDSDGFAQTVAKLYGLQVIRQSGRIHLRAVPAS